MLHSDIYKIFKEYFPAYYEKVDVWFQNGWNSIRIRYKNKAEHIFTFHNSNDWKLETVKSFISGLKGGKK